MQKTRRSILNILKERGRVTIKQLSNELSLTRVTIRHHLTVLGREGLIAKPDVLRRNGPGRREHVYMLSEKASDYFPNNHAGFADLMFSEIKDSVTPCEFESILQGMAQRMAAEAPQPVRGETFSSRLERVVSFLNQKGYAARWERNERGYMLYQTHCPYRRLAACHHETCYMDLMLIANLLGVRAQRTHSLVHGDRECAYLIPHSVEKHLSTVDK